MRSLYQFYCETGGTDAIWALPERSRWRALHPLQQLMAGPRFDPTAWEPPEVVWGEPRIDPYDVCGFHRRPAIRPDRLPGLASILERGSGVLLPLGGKGEGWFVHCNTGWVELVDVERTVPPSASVNTGTRYALFEDRLEQNAAVYCPGVGMVTFEEEATAAPSSPEDCGVRAWVLSQGITGLAFIKLWDETGSYAVRLPFEDLVKDVRTTGSIPQPKPATDADSVSDQSGGRPGVVPVDLLVEVEPAAAFVRDLLAEHATQSDEPVTAIGLAIGNPLFGAASVRATFETRAMNLDEARRIIAGRLSIDPRALFMLRDYDFGAAEPDDDLHSYWDFVMPDGSMQQIDLESDEVGTCMVRFGEAVMRALVHLDDIKSLNLASPLYLAVEGPETNETFLWQWGGSDHPVEIVAE